MITTNLRYEREVEDSRAEIKSLENLFSEIGHGPFTIKKRLMPIQTYLVFDNDTQSSVQLGGIVSNGSEKTYIDIHSTGKKNMATQIQNELNKREYRGTK